MTASAANPSLDPDALAELERERDFLLRSLDDLDAEHRVGDMDDADHAGLNDDYTRRLAEVSRAIDEQRAAFVNVDTKLSSGQRWLTIAGITIVALLAGLLLARASGFRSPTESVSGDIRQSSAGLLAEADTLTREGQWEEAIKVYGEVLDISPANVEALTYRGWITPRLFGDNAAALDDLAEAVAVDGDFPDARVFSAILLDDEQRYVEAAEQIAVIDSLDMPDEMLGLISGSNLRASVAAGQITETFASGDQIDLTQISATIDDVARAGALLTQEGELVLAQASFEAVLVEEPENIIALVGRGQLARDPDIFAAAPDVAADALASLDRAIELAPGELVILVYRADARLVQGDLEGARQDLAQVDPESLSRDVQALYADLDARIN